MKILVLSNQFPPDVNSSGQLMKQIFSKVADHGHDLTVITTFPHYENFEVWDEYKGKLFSKEKSDGLNVIRLWSYTWGKKNMINRLINYISYNLLTVITAILIKKNYDIIFAQNGSFFTGLSAWFISLLNRTKYIYNIQDLYPEVPIRAGKLNSMFLISILRQIEFFMYRKASHISVIAPSFKKNIIKKGITREKISIIPNFVDTEFIQPLPRSNNFSKKHNLDDKFVVSHAGNIGTAYDLDTLLVVASELSDIDEILFLIIGEGIAKSDLINIKKKLDLENVMFLPYQPREDLPWIRASSDVQVSVYKFGSAKYSLPSKIYEIMASERPVLASAEKDSDVYQLIEKAECGVCVEPENEKQLREAIIKLYQNPKLCRKLGQRGRKYVEEHNSLEIVSDRYCKLLQRKI